MPNSFTPGPWFIEDNGRAISSRIATDIALVNMANIRYGWDGPDFLTASHRAANARLIAAAPDLLAALEALLDYENDIQKAIAEQMARAAIAKAGGES